MEITNPIIAYCKDYLNIPISSITKIFIEYSDGEISPIANIVYSSDKDLKTEKREIDIMKFADLFSFLTQIELTTGIEYDSLFLSHRKVRSLSFILPDGLLHIELDDEVINVNVSENIHESMRSLIHVLK